MAQHDNIIAEYIWIDGALGLRSKCRTLPQKVAKLEDIPQWNFDGSSTNQAVTECSEVIIKPVFFFPDPFRGGDNIMVLTETFVWADTTWKTLVPANTNFRHFAKAVFDADMDEKPWYGIEQEYVMMKEATKFRSRPVGWPNDGFPSNQGPYYCSVGGNACFMRKVVDMHYLCCLHAGIQISGTNAEVMPGQWEFQVGPCLGIGASDQVWAARYLLQRCAEVEGLTIDFEPKPFADWNGSGCHTNFSTETMRSGTKGMPYIHDMMKKLDDKHMSHMELYGLSNEKRLTGIHETSPFDKFSYGVGHRGTSVRIPTATAAEDGAGYFEDRRPASNMDPYVVTAMLYDTCVLDDSKAAPLIEKYREWAAWIKTAKIEKP